MTYNQGAVVVVPFPFTDINAAKRRPALIISQPSTFNHVIGHSVMAMITSATHAAWPLDTPITNLSAAGLKAPSLIRLKLFTLDHTLIIKTISALAPVDQVAFDQHLNALLNGQ